MAGRSNVPTDPHSFQSDTLILERGPAERETVTRDSPGEFDHLDGWPPATIPLTRSATQTSPPRYLLAALLLAMTFFATTTLGAGWYLSTRTDVTTDLLPWLGPDTIQRVWSDPQLLLIGLSFSIPVLIILLAHELGHYFACRKYNLPATLPYFIPAPVALGTLGAFIRIRAVIRTKRELLDIGVSGPIAGFITLIPFLLYGVAQSRPAVLRAASELDAAELMLILPGRSVAIELATRLFHGKLPDGVILDLHPFALAAWVGLLATSLNLLPLGQLDGGHILYAATGKLQRRLAIPLLLILGAAGWFWRGWLVWCVIVLVMGIYHPRVLDEEIPLDRVRRWIVVAAVVIFVLSFMPVPVSIVPVI